MSVFSIAAAQIPSRRGDIDTNVAAHAPAIEAAAKSGIAVVVFPELSLTGYEPDLAAELAVSAEDSRLVLLRDLAQQFNTNAIVGAPLQNSPGKPYLGAILFTANGETQTYRKMHLGGTESNYFESGNTPLTLEIAGHKVGLAICADTSQASHPQSYRQGGADVYAAGVFLNAEWYATDAPRLARYAAQFNLLTLMANHAASTGTLSSVGRSAIWAPGGDLLAQAAGTETCLVIAKCDQAEWHGEIFDI